MSNVKAYLDGKFLMNLEPLLLPKLYVISHTLTDYPVVIHREDGYYHAKYSGEVWRVCDEYYCFTAVFPTKEAAEMFANSSPMLGGYGYERVNNRTN